MPSLPEMLRVSTRELHVRAERAGVMGELIRGQLAREGYVALLRNLHGLYEALEARPLPVASLRRTEALAADLDAIHGSGWVRAFGLCESTREYIARLQRADAPALAAHVYVRYLGDLHGGQILSAIVRGAYGLSGRLGTAFYDFGLDDDVVELRTSVRTGLASLTFAAPEMQQAATEAAWAFDQHIKLFEEVAGAPRRSDDDARKVTMEKTGGRPASSLSERPKS
jgi:heme oxygenase (biliverdin-producing, ferredoxin)